MPSRIVASVAVVACLAGCTSLLPAPAALPLSGDASVRIAYVAYPVITPKATLQVAGVLRVPRSAIDPAPAVLIVHGSGGIDGRGQALANELNSAGIATFEIDLWTPRGVRSPAERPKHVAETLPDVYAAFQVLAANSAIDKTRIGITGFSWGGVVSMLTATSKYSEQYLGKEMKFAAHAPHYPVCWAYNRAPGYTFRDLTGAPILIQAGELDDYDQPDTCPKLIASLPDKDRALIKFRIYPEATHGWDSSLPPMTYNDPYAHLGKGGEFRFFPNPKVAVQSRAAAVQFFRCSFGMSGCVPA